ncbi:acyltransferase family protein [Paenibacillus glucanolyticus]|uniref:acyltransferase family protein n=1 Tax=Paenibacillus glucanolyticus TaxID=59843 RepID=UPI00096E5A52|nr:acyltransferase [Paenibacillus glucanolyticus]OMF70517.1 hypothetical protein BK142_23880 [Paenibacillus glucanolyticus]
MKPNINPSERIWFAHVVRGLACLIVVYYHLGEMFWRSNDLASQISFSSPIEKNHFLPHLHLTDWLYRFNFNFGSFGVGLFFLVSGFVIPISIEKLGSGKFIFRRIFRLYPTYIIGLFLSFAVLYLSSIYSNVNFIFTIKDYIKNASLFRDWFWVPTIDNVNWTLENEVKFYLLCAFIAWISNLRNPKTMTITIGSLCIIGYAVSGTLEFLINNNLFYLYKMFYIITNSAPFLTYMFIGTCIYNLYKNYWDKKTFCSVVLFLSLAFSFNTYNAFGKISLTGFLVNYSLAFLVFGSLYLLRNKIPQIKLLDFFANISYPMYVIHGVLGYALLSFLYKFQPYPYLILIEVFLIITALSYIIHVLVEKPSNKIGYKLSKPLQLKENHNPISSNTSKLESSI